jgi:hypothetical protein
MDVLRTVAAKIAPHVVHGDEEDVGPFRSLNNESQATEDGVEADEAKLDIHVDSESHSIFTRAGFPGTTK